MWWGLCCCKERSPTNEIWRLRLNWLLLLVTGMVTGIGVNTQVAFHQFVTNPSQENLNELEDSPDIESGLGMSESFYSWGITAVNLGQFAGALLAGVLARFMPYTLLILSALLLHTGSYLMYASTSEPWVLILSRLMAGIFEGMEMTLAPAYFSASYNSEYLKALKELGIEENKWTKLKDVLYTFHAIAMVIGTALGTGAAVIFSTLDISQFRAVAWLNAGVGVVAIILLLVIFREENKCSNSVSCTLDVGCSWFHQRQRIRIEWMGFFIITFLVVVKATRNFSYILYQTMYNPILSDQFGFTERGESLFFFGLVGAQLIGALLLFGMQESWLNNRMIVMIGIISVIAGTILMTDWQAISHRDPCIEYSVFHHPELVDEYTEELINIPSLVDDPAIECFKSKVYAGDSADVILQVNAYFSSVDSLALKLDSAFLEASCMEATSCSTCTHSTTAALSTLCIPFTLSSTSQKLYVTGSSLPNENTVAYMCSFVNSTFSVCVTVLQDTIDSSQSSQTAKLQQQIFPEVLSEVYTESLQVIEGCVYELAVNKCKALDNDYGCRWIPDSAVTGEYCDECQPICRSVYHTLNFVQFCLGAILMKLSLPTSRVSAVNIITDVVEQNLQSMAIGVAYAAAAIINIISPPWMDATYEAAGKRTYLTTMILLCVHFLVLAGMAVLYPKLGEKQALVRRCGRNDEKENDEDNSTEMTTLMSQTAETPKQNGGNIGS